MNRINRLTAIIIYLQGRQRVTVDELAERNEISTRTVYRDLRVLQEAGVPIGSEQGEGYFIVKGYHLPPVMFDQDEAAELLAGERLMQKWSETKLSKSYLPALDKIRSVLHSREKEYLNTLDQHIKAFPYPDEKHFETDRVFCPLAAHLGSGSKNSTARQSKEKSPGIEQRIVSASQLKMNS